MTDLKDKAIDIPGKQHVLVKDRILPAVRMPIDLVSPASERRPKAKLVDWLPWSA